jgi:dTDP-4-amino-4,6-dideoxygalactose transaminase
MIEYENLNRLNKPFSEEYLKKTRDILENGQFILGDHVSEFEKQFASYCGSKFCAGVGNGLDALTLALKSFCFERGSEVLVPSNTYIASILAILNANLRPVLVEPDVATYTIDPMRLEEAITKKTVAVIVVHLYGKCCDMASVLGVASKFKLKVIEDCAQAHGARFNNQRAGSFGDLGAFSFYPTKNLGALGDAGCLTMNNEEQKNKIDALRNYGSKKKYYNDIVGINSRLDELQAAFLTIKLKSLDRINEHKRKLASIYTKELKPDFIKPIVDQKYHDVYHIYNVRHSKRDQLREYLLKNQIGTEIHYPIPPHRQGALKGILSKNEFPISEEIHATTLSLPISTIHSEEDVNRVVDVMNKF